MTRVKVHDVMAMRQLYTHSERPSSAQKVAIAVEHERLISVQGIDKLLSADLSLVMAFQRFGNGLIPKKTPTTSEALARRT